MRESRTRWLSGAVFALSLACHVFVPGPRAEAQCDSNCYSGGHHWTFGGLAGTSASEWIVIGLSGLGPNGTAPYKPVACAIDPWTYGLVAISYDNNFSYPSRMIAQTDVSFCAHGGDDTVLFLTDYQGEMLACFTPFGPVNLQSFVVDQDLIVSGGAGNDRLELAAGNDTVNVAMCGGDHNDALLGDEFGQYMVGGNGNDFIHGGAHYDNVRGSAGDDVIWHKHTGIIWPGNAGEDRLRGDSGKDCFDFDDGVAYSPASDCGTNHDTYEDGNVTPYLPPPNCEQLSAGDNCCAESGKYCPLGS